MPGSVLDDLWRLGEIANPYFERNWLLCEWVPQRTRVYKKAFHVPGVSEMPGTSSASIPHVPGASKVPGTSGKPPRARLVFEGVDYEAEFLLNGESLETHRGMYTPASFAVGDKLRYGEENLLAVVIAAAPHEEP